MKHLKLLLSVNLVVMLTVWSMPASADCPVALPKPADQPDVQCKAEENDSRCGNGLPWSICTAENNEANSLGLLTGSAYNWLNSNGYCALTDYGFILAICPVGCFEESTQIMTAVEDEERQVSWMAAKDITTEDSLASLSIDSELSFPDMLNRAIKRMTRGPEETPLYAFHLTNGRLLQVTQHHAMVLADGSIVEAQEVQAGDIFVGVDGSDVVVRAITRKMTKSDVYNFWVDTTDPQEHIIAAEGVLVGDLAWQSTLSGEMSSINLRR